MAYTIGKFGIGKLWSLAALMGCFYATCLLFVFVVLGLIARLNGFSIWRLVAYLREELLIVLGTSSSEAALPRMRPPQPSPIPQQPPSGATLSLLFVEVQTDRHVNVCAECRLSARSATETLPLRRQ